MLEDNYVGGKKHGLHQSWHDNGQLVSKKNYFDDKKHGLQQGWHGNGKLKFKANYVNGKRHGLEQWWNKDGQKSLEENYFDGKKDGLHQGWHENGKLKFKANYVNDKQHGLLQEWYPNRQLAHISHSQSGFVMKFYENGKSKMKLTYIPLKKGSDSIFSSQNKDDVNCDHYPNFGGLLDHKSKPCQPLGYTLDGSYERWYKNGQKEIEETYYDGKRDGLSKRWYENGQLMVMRNYVKDKIHGPLQSWTREGKKRFEINYDNGVKNGRSIEWYTDDDLSITEKVWIPLRLRRILPKEQIKIESEFKNGQMISNDVYSISGEKLQEWNLGATFRTDIVEQKTVFKRTLKKIRRIRKTHYDSLNKVHYINLNNIKSYEDESNSMPTGQ